MSSNGDVGATFGAFGSRFKRHGREAILELLRRANRPKTMVATDQNALLKTYFERALLGLKFSHQHPSTDLIEMHD